MPHATTIHTTGRSHGGPRLNRTAPAVFLGILLAGFGATASASDGENLPSRRTPPTLAQPAADPDLWLDANGVPRPPPETGQPASAEVKTVAAAAVAGTRPVTAAEPGGPAVAAVPVAYDQAVSLVEGATVYLYLQWSDADNPPARDMRFTIVSGPDHGTLTESSKGVYTYRPALGYSGADGFSWYVTDKEGNQSGTATASLTVTRNTPPVVETSAALVLVGIVPQWNLLRYHDSDSGQNLTTELVSGPSHGTVQMNTPSTGRYIYTPDSGFTGDDTFTWRAYDGLAYSENATAVMRVRDWGDRKAIGAKIAAIAAAENGGGFYDVGTELDYYPYALSENTGYSAWCSEFVSWSYKAGGDPFGTPTGYWMLGGYPQIRSWFEQNRVFLTPSSPEWATYEPRPGDYLYWDGHSGMVWYMDGDTLVSIEGNVGDRVASRRFGNWRNEIPGIGVRVVSCINDPVARAGSDQLVHDTDRDGFATVTLDGSASTDPDGSLVSYAWSEAGLPLGTGLTVTITLAVGTHDIVLTVTDNLGNTDTDTVRVTVNRPPLPGDDTASVAANHAIIIAVLANDQDPDGQPVTIQSCGQPAQGTAAIVGNAIGYTSTSTWTGSDSFSYTVTDPLGGTATATVNVTVVADVAPPVLLGAVCQGDRAVVTVTFDEKVQPGAGVNGAENPANYAIDNGIAIAAAQLSADGRSVHLSTSAVADGTSYTLTVNHVGDLAAPPNAVAADSQAVFQYSPLAPGLVYEYYHGSWSVLPDFDVLTPVAEGTVATFDISVRTQNDNFGFRFTGKILIETAGSYTFYITSDDGSKLYLNGSQLVDNDGLHGMQERSGTVTLTAGYHDIVVTMFEQGGGEGLEVCWEGPGIAKTIIPAAVLFHLATGANHPPTIDSPAWADPNPVTLPAGTTVHVVASDPDADPLTYAWTQEAGPGTATFAAPSAADSGVTFSVAGSYVLRVTVSDGKGGSVASDVSVTVNPGSGVDPRADLNHDGVVNALDLQIVIASFGQAVPGADPRADANADGVVNALDLQLIIANFGQSVP